MQRLVFFGFADWGYHYHWESFAQVLERLAKDIAQPSFMLAVGDNIYPNGATSAKDSKLLLWKKIFVNNAHESIRVPWNLILGNHDYHWDSNGRNGEVDFTFNKEHNAERLWNLPDRNYQFKHEIPNSGGKFVEFFGVDTNAAQWSVQKEHSGAKQALILYMASLTTLLQQSTATWKIVFGHHPLYTGGAGHQAEARCLRGFKYTTGSNSQVHEGIGMEDALRQGGADLYISGHDHVTQYIEDPTCRLKHFVVGAALEVGYYQGKFGGGASGGAETPLDPHRSITLTGSCIDWALESSCGVCIFNVGVEDIMVQVANTTTGEVCKEFVVSKFPNKGSLKSLTKTCEE